MCTWMCIGTHNGVLVSGGGTQRCVLSTNSQGILHQPLCVVVCDITVCVHPLTGRPELRPER